MTDLAAQIADELDRALAGPVGSLLGLDLAEHVEQRISDRVPMLAAQLVGDDKRLAAQTAIDLVCALFPGDQQPDPAWWRTPLGVAVALTYRPEEEMTVASTTEVLGVTRSRVYQLIDAGKLDRGVVGGVTLSSVLGRVAETHERQERQDT